MGIIEATKNKVFDDILDYFHENNNLETMNENEIENIVETIVEENYNTAHISDENAEEICSTIRNFRLFQDYYEQEFEELTHNTFNETIEKCLLMMALNQIYDIIEAIKKELLVLKELTLEEIPMLQSDIIANILKWI